MRGKLWLVSGQETGSRITPAHAGKTGTEQKRCECDGDHPRACGENLSTSRSPEMMRGSPPRMRGKPYFMMRRIGWNRITPAHAGKTYFRHAMSSKQQDHPRACGENTSETAYFRG